MATTVRTAIEATNKVTECEDRKKQPVIRGILILVQIPARLLSSTEWRGDGLPQYY